MKDERKMGKRRIRIVVSIIIMSFLVCPAPVFGYLPEVHERIASEAIGRSEALDESLRQIGFEKGIETIIQRPGMASLGIPSLEIQEWIQYGSGWEDWVYVWKLEYDKLKSCHFYDPINDKGFYDDQGTEIGESLTYRANDADENEWSYPVAKEYYYAALTGNSTKYAYWEIWDEKKFAPSSFIGEFRGHLT